MQEPRNMQANANSPQRIVVGQRSQAPIRPPPGQKSHVRAFKKLGWIQFIIGPLLIVLQVIHDILTESSSNAAAAVYALGVTVTLTGVSAIVTVKTKNINWFITFLIFGVLDLLFAVFVAVFVLRRNRKAGIKYKGLTGVVAAIAVLEGFLMTVVCLGIRCLVECMHKPPLNKDNSQRLTSDQVIVLSHLLRQRESVQVQQTTVNQGQPLLSHGQNGVHNVQQPEYQQDIQLRQGHMEPSPYSQNVPTSQRPIAPPQCPYNIPSPPSQENGYPSPPPPYTKRYKKKVYMQPQTVQSEPRYVIQNQAQGHEAMVHQRNALDYELPTSPDGTGDPQYPKPIGNHNEYGHPDEDNLRNWAIEGEQKEQPK